MIQKEEMQVCADEWIPEFICMLEKGMKVKIAPQGGSMLPLLDGKKDEVILGKVEKILIPGDVVLYRRETGRYVLHRIHHIKEDGFYMIGDSQTWIEGPIEKNQIIAVAEEFVRKGKIIKCTDFSYRVWKKVWLKLRKSRPVWIHIWWRIHKIRKRMCVCWM